jgi:hypothetical protein
MSSDETPKSHMFGVNPLTEESSTATAAERPRPVHADCERCGAAGSMRLARLGNLAAGNERDMVVEWLCDECGALVDGIEVGPESRGPGRRPMRPRPKPRARSKSATRDR